MSGEGNNAERVTIYDVHNDGEHVRLRRFPAVVTRALRLVWAGARRELILVTAFQTIGGVGLILPILASRNLLSALVNAGGATLPVVLREVVVLLVVSVLLSFATSVASARDRLLSERVMQYTQGRILDVTCAVEWSHSRRQRSTTGSSSRRRVLATGLSSWCTGSLR
jgi:hypothetical protein